MSTTPTPTPVAPATAASTTAAPPIFARRFKRWLLDEAAYGVGQGFMGGYAMGGSSVGLLSAMTTPEGGVPRTRMLLRVPLAGGRQGMQVGYRGGVGLCFHTIQGLLCGVRETDDWTNTTLAGIATGILMTSRVGLVPAMAGSSVAALFLWAAYLSRDLFAGN